MRIGRASWLTDTGRKRLRNEDAYVFEPPLFAIADGMGGARAGEVAAGLAAAALRDGSRDIDDAEGLEAAIDEANRRVWERSIADPETAGMGTTVTIAVVDAPAERVLFGHVGDSRAYRLREGALEQITTDHSLVAELVESGVLTPEEAARHPQRSAITRAVGTERAIEADVFSVPALPGDVFLLCSDGLTDMLLEEEIAGCIVDADGDPERAARALVAAANARGGEDNITVVLFELVEAAGVPELVEVGADDAGSSEQAATAVAPALEDVPATPVDGGEAEPGDDETAGASARSLRRHGAGPGGRVAALLLIVGVLLVAAFVVYWSLKR
jgi:PPM family protein phosphatase